MEGLKNLKKGQKEILKNSESILYTRKIDLGNLCEKEVIKHENKFYRIQATNKKVIEFVEV